jgi:hypothetical protein
VNPPDRRPVTLAGLGLVAAGAVLGLALAVPATANAPDSPRPTSTGSAPGTGTRSAPGSGTGSAPVVGPGSASVVDRDFPER